MQIGLRHPDPIVETSSLASVEPPEVWYELAMPQSVYETGALSALQLEAIVYTCQKVYACKYFEFFLAALMICFHFN